MASESRPGALREDAEDEDARSMKLEGVSYMDAVKRRKAAIEH